VLLWSLKHPDQYLMYQLSVNPAFIKGAEAVAPPGSVSGGQRPPLQSGDRRPYRNAPGEGTRPTVYFVDFVSFVVN